MEDYPGELQSIQRKRKQLRGKKSLNSLKRGEVEEFGGRMITRMRFFFLDRFFYFLIFGIIIGSWGCASQNIQQNAIKTNEYKKIMARQKAEMADEEAALKKVPQMNSEGYERSGDQYLGQGKMDLAFKQYFEASRLDSGQTRLRYKIGRLFLEKGMAEEAKKEFQGILETTPRYALAYEGLGRAYFHTREFSEAEKNFREAIQLDPELWQAHNFLGITYDRQGNYDAALTAYKAAITLKPNVGSLFNNLGMSLFLNGEHEKAVMAFTEAVKIEPSNQRMCNNLGLALYKLGRYPEALEVFKRGGDEPGAYYNMGSLFMMEGKNREAVVAFEKAIEAKPAFYTRAYEKKKKAQAALDTPQQE